MLDFPKGLQLQVHGFELVGEMIYAVSHAYHLPRVAGLYAREAQLEVHTDPAPMQHVMLKMPWFVAREAAALYVLWLDRALHRRTVPGR